MKVIDLSTSLSPPPPISLSLFPISLSLSLSSLISTCPCLSLSPLSLPPPLSSPLSRSLSPLPLLSRCLLLLSIYLFSIASFFLSLSLSLSLSISCLSLLFNSIVFSSPLSFIHSLSFPNLFSLSPLLPPLICVLSHKCPSSTVYLSSPLFSFISLSLVSLPLCFSLYHTAIGKFPPLLP